MAKRGGFPGGGMPGNMANLMKQAQKMQRQMEEQAKEMETCLFCRSGKPLCQKYVYPGLLSPESLCKGRGIQL